MRVHMQRHGLIGVRTHKKHFVNKFTFSTRILTNKQKDVF